ncbi:MAG: LamG domain-containing protein [Ignavibacteria bacterium]|nr:LamG domain-containing protein [Ignavibacteria bacterium]MBK7575885.1 LamG domain-containing protein [Ignavibacteria bacterium]MBK9182664.1 LamG domain-containing protein [Ignavibacteria bacterium]
MIIKKLLGYVFIIVLALCLAPYLRSQPGPMTVHQWASITIEAYVNGERANPEIVDVEISAPAGRTTRGRTRFDSLDPGSYTIVARIGPYVGTKRVIARAGESTTERIYMSESGRDKQVARIILRDAVFKEPMTDHSVQFDSDSSVTTDAEGGVTKTLVTPGTSFTITGLVQGKRSFVGRVTTVPGATMRYVVDVASDYWQNPITNGLLAWYPMNSGADTLKDASPFHRNGTYGSSQPTECVDRHGANGGARFFSNGTDAAVVPDSAWQCSFPMTVSFWIKVDKRTAETSFFLGKYLHPNGEGWSVFFEGERLCAGYFRSNFNNWSRVNTVTEIDSLWHHVVITIASDQLTLYVDGARAPARPFATPGVSTTTTEPLSIGKIRSTINHSINGFVGAFDDIMFFNRVLDEAEIRKLGE